MFVQEQHTYFRDIILCMYYFFITTIYGKKLFKINMKIILMNKFFNLPDLYSFRIVGRARSEACADKSAY